MIAISYGMKMFYLIIDDCYYAASKYVLVYKLKAITVNLLHFEILV